MIGEFKKYINRFRNVNEKIQEIKVSNFQKLIIRLSCTESIYLERPLIYVPGRQKFLQAEIFAEFIFVILILSCVNKFSERY